MGTIFFSVGEPSGDLHAANLIRAMQQQTSPKQPMAFRGFGGPRMQQAGCTLDYQLTNLAVMGFAEVLPKLREFFRVADLGSDIFRDARPDAVVLVDFPGFNWHIAKRAKRAGVPVFYYLPPQLWAWGSWRLRKMRRYVDHVLCNLPFEPQWYAQRDLQVEYVGHPFFDEVVERELDQSFLQQWQDWDGVQVAVLPGSRSREVEKIWPLQLQMIRALANRYPQTRFLIAAYKQQQLEQCQRLLTTDDRNLPLHFFSGKTSELIELADCALMKSGSVSLEMMARKTPAVVIYHASRSLYTIGKCLVNLKSMTLPNLIAQQTVMPEFLAVGQSTTATQQATKAMAQLIESSDVRQAQCAQLSQLADKYAQPGASHEAAKAILRLLNPSAQSRSARAAA